MSDDKNHFFISLRLCGETGLIFLILSLLIIVTAHQWWLYLAVAALGLWFNRLYIIAHEAVHRKLFPNHPLFNDFIGTIILLPIMAPLTIYRKIHFFHHAHNRESPGIATLDTFRDNQPLTWLKNFYYQLIWLFCVFCGGFFLHSLISILLFLFLPTHLGEKISPAFQGWKLSARLKAWCEFLLAITFHLVIYKFFGFDIWLNCFGKPLLIFAWIWSMWLYIYHYRTTMGKQVIYNVRSLKPNFFFSWLMLNFNEHITHHSNPQIPWYLLPEKRIELPPEFASNQNVNTLSEAIWQQISVRL